MFPVGTRELARMLQCFRRPLSPGTYYPWEMYIRREDPRLWKLIVQTFADTYQDSKNGSTAEMRKLLGWIIAPIYFAFSEERFSWALVGATQRFEELLEDTDPNRDQAMPFFGALRRANPKWESKVRIQLKKFGDDRFLFYFFDLGAAILECAHAATKKSARNPQENPFDPNHPDNWRMDL